MSPSNRTPSREQRSLSPLNDITEKIKIYIFEFSPFRSAYKKQRMQQLFFFLEHKNFLTALHLIEQFQLDQEFCYAVFSKSYAKQLIDECALILSKTNPSLTNPENHLIRRFPTSKFTFTGYHQPKFFDFNVSNISLFKVKNDHFMLIEEQSFDHKECRIIIRGSAQCKQFISGIKPTQRQHSDSIINISKQIQQHAGPSMLNKLPKPATQQRVTQAPWGRHPMNPIGTITLTEEERIDIKSKELIENSSNLSMHKEVLLNNTFRKLYD